MLIRNNLSLAFLLFVGSLQAFGTTRGDSLNRDMLLPIALSSIQVSVDKNAIIGREMAKNKVLENMYFIDLRPVNLEKVLIEGNVFLYRQNFNVAGHPAQCVYELKADITEIDIVKRGSSNIESNLTIEWVLKEVNAKEELMRVSQSGKSIVNDKGLVDSFQSAFLENLREILVGQPVVKASVTPPLYADRFGQFSPISVGPVMPSTKKSIKEVSKSVVTIQVKDLGHGSGFFISEQGHILTNYHVVAGQTDVDIETHDGTKFKASVLRVDKASDLALLKSDNIQFPPLSISQSEDDADLGITVLAIGTPSDTRLAQTVTKGIISGFRKTNGQPFIQTDCSVSPGNSGGPLINESGLVLGIVTAKLIDKGVEGISFAIPISEALRLLSIEFK